MTEGMTITEFLLARIAEDETNDTTLIGAERKDWTARWMAECEAKRRIVERSVAMTGVTLDDDWPLNFLALPYADHPDYRDEWRP